MAKNPEYNPIDISLNSLLFPPGLKLNRNREFTVKESNILNQPIESSGLIPLKPFKLVNPLTPGEIYSIPGTPIICLYPILRKFLTGALYTNEYSREKYPVG